MINQMILAIMQPYFMPFIGYFTLIKHTEYFILFDTPQYIRHGWIDRNRIIKPNGEMLYVKVPLKKHHRETRINEIIIDNSQNWQGKILAQLVPYKKEAISYREVVQLLEEIFDHQTDSIVELNLFSLRKICDFLEIATPVSIWSEMNMVIDEVKAPDEWALNMCKALKADVYYNPIGGTSFFDRAKYENAGIIIKFMQMESTLYRQFSNKFVPFLSIIDVMMFNNIKGIRSMLDKYYLK